MKEDSDQSWDEGILREECQRRNGDWTKETATREKWMGERSPGNAVGAMLRRNSEKRRDDYSWQCSKSFAVASSNSYTSRVKIAGYHVLMGLSLMVLAIRHGIGSTTSSCTAFAYLQLATHSNIIK